MDYILFFSFIDVWFCDKQKIGTSFIRSSHLYYTQSEQYTLPNCHGGEGRSDQNTEEYIQNAEVLYVVKL